MRVLLPLKAKQQQRPEESPLSSPRPTSQENLESTTLVARAAAVASHDDDDETAENDSPQQYHGDWWHYSNKKRRLEVEDESLSKRLCQELDLDLNRKPAAKPTKRPSVASNYLDRKLPAKMTAGRYADERRDPPALEENDPEGAHGLDAIEENNPAGDFSDEAEVAVATYQRQENPAPTAEHDEAEEKAFVKALKQRGLEILPQEGDGNCLFRAVSLQVYGSADMHTQIRKQCLDHMAKDEEHFSHFVTGEAFADYIARKRQDGVHGNNPEIQAISELFNRPVEVFTPDNGAAPLNIFQTEYKTADVPIRLSYHDGNHYNAVVDPLCPTAGLGLGLPNLQPGLADKMQVAKAVQESEHQLADQMLLKQAIEDSSDDAMARALKESTLYAAKAQSDKAMALSDVDATNFELEQAMLESSMIGKLGPATASIPAAASVPAAASLNHDPDEDKDHLLRSPEDYPQVVQELVMNGFELRKVVRAYELIGDSFDDLLAFLVSTSST